MHPISKIANLYKADLVRKGVVAEYPTQSICVLFAAPGNREKVVSVKPELNSIYCDEYYTYSHGSITKFFSTFGEMMCHIGHFIEVPNFPKILRHSDLDEEDIVFGTRWSKALKESFDRNWMWAKPFDDFYKELMML